MPSLGQPCLWTKLKRLPPKWEVLGKEGKEPAAPGPEASAQLPLC